MDYNGLGQRLSMGAAGVIATYMLDTSTWLRLSGLIAESSGNTTIYLSSIVTLNNVSPAGNSAPGCGSRGASEASTSMPLMTCPKIVY